MWRVIVTKYGDYQNGSIIYYTSSILETISRGHGPKNFRYISISWYNYTHYIAIFKYIPNHFKKFQLSKKKNFRYNFCTIETVNHISNKHLIFLILISFKKTYQSRQKFKVQKIQSKKILQIKQIINHQEIKFN